MLSANQSIGEKIKGFERIMQLFEASNSGLWEISANGKMNFFNSSFYKNFDINLENSHLSEWTALIHPDDLAMFDSNVDFQVTNNIEMLISEYRVRDKLGNYVWIEGRGVANYNKDKEMLYMVGSHVDITEYKLHEENINYLAYHDQLTGLYNRTKLIDLLDSRIKINEQGYFIYLNLNNFKLFNDTYGQKFCDDVLINVAFNMKRIFTSKCDVFRLSESEFGILSHTNNSRTNIEELFQEFHNSHIEKISLKGKTIETQLSAVICEFPTGIENVEDLIHQTSLTMHYARNKLDGKCTFFDENIQKSIGRELHIETGLIQALNNNEMYLNYQPIINVNNGYIDGFEALIRWKSEKWGEIYPVDFIPVAERTLEIIDIGFFVLKTACRFIKKNKDLGINIPNISVNVSVIQLLRADFAEQVMSILESENLSPRVLTIEITESLMMDTQKSSIIQLQTLKDNGIGIALDDFGTGYSSLNNLITIPLTKLKVDREVMLKAMDSSTISEFVTSLTTLCHQNNLVVVAEGIETKEMATKARAMGMDLLQGYLYSKPIPEKEALIFLDLNNKSKYEIK